MDVTGSMPGDRPKVDTAERPVLQDEWRIFDLFTSEEFAPGPTEFALRNGAPGTIAGWKAVADGLLTNPSCIFHRNLEISSCYAWIYKLLPECLRRTRSRDSRHQDGVCGHRSQSARRARG